jgi:hypothetical protein
MVRKRGDLGSLAVTDVTRMSSSARTASVAYEPSALPAEHRRRHLGWSSQLGTADGELKRGPRLLLLDPRTPPMRSAVLLPFVHLESVRVELGTLVLALMRDSLARWLRGCTGVRLAFSGLGG